MRANCSAVSGATRSSKSRKKGARSTTGSHKPDQETPPEDEAASVSTEDGGASSVNVGTAKSRKDDEGGKVIPSAADEEDLPPMKETEHVPIIKERLVEDKISAILTACFHGDVAQVDALMTSTNGEITFSCKDSAERTPLHVAASEGNEEVVKYLLEQKADPASKDRFGARAHAPLARTHTCALLLRD